MFGDERDGFLYEGIVIQNNDPEKIGRVKVFVPGITNTIYDNWNSTPTDKEFSSIDGDLEAIIGDLRDDLPWAVQAQSFFGGDNDHSYHNGAKATATRNSDSVTPEDSYNHTGQLTPPKYSGKCAGLFSIPSVGSHVYVFFKLGNTNYPVYFAASRGKSDWNEIYNDENYPSEGGSYTNKHVLNTLKHSLEFVDSDGKEAINLTHFDGSNIKMLKDYVSKYCVKDDITLIEGDKYETIKKDVKLTIDANETVNIGGNNTITIGGNLTITVTGAIKIQDANGKGIEIVNGNVNITGTTINLN